MSDDRVRETEDGEEPREESPGAPQPASAAAVRRERSSNRPSGAQRAGIAGKDHPTRPRGATETKAALPARL
ncbi:MAG: hypothetical protein ACRDS9_10020, partial [Pseudonocardiaceae bacterium]